MTPTTDNPVVIARVPRDAGDDGNWNVSAFRWGCLGASAGHAAQVGVGGVVRGGG
ncbi:hypothetical protein [Kribbella sindirgiensis]|uniref:hypothetical protein n=1 Tax=Kribbella sindirgiensis TaxID=1124744 RepID=UPI0013F3D8C9|nr:hypothetical protein [Kribbella sindirgiensis]